MSHEAADPNARAPQPLRAVLIGIDRLGRVDGWIGGGCLLALTLLILAEIGTRFFSRFLPFLPGAIPAAWEISSYFMAAAFTFGAAMTLRAGGHIRVTLLVGRLEGGAKRALEVAASAFAFCFMAFLTWAMARFAMRAFERGQVSLGSDFPLWIPQAVITFGMLLLTLQFLARAVQAALGLPLEDHRMKPPAPVE